MRVRSPLLATIALAAAACGPHSPDPPADGFVRAIQSGDPQSLTLIGNTDRFGSDLGRLISDPLVDHDAAGGYVPRVAQSWTVSDDGREVAFRLRDGVRWHDGTAVVARDVVFTADRVRDPATQARTWASQFVPVESVTAEDARTVVVRYREAVADPLEAWRVPLVPSHLADAGAGFLTGAYSRHPVGCGAYRFVRHVPGVEVVVEANADYWDGPPANRGLTFRILRDDRTSYEALLRGDVDIWVATPDFWREAQTSPRAGRLARFVNERQAIWYLGCNLDGSNPFFGDPRVRRALTHALDRESFAASVVRGLGRPPATTYLPGNPWRDAAVSPRRFDPGLARALLAEAGWRDTNADGILDRDGRPFSFSLLYASGNQEIADRIAAWIQRSLAEVGLEVRLERLDWQIMQQRRREGRFEAAMASWLLGLTPDQWEAWHSTARANGLNYGGLRDADVDRLLERGRVERDPVARREIYAGLQRRLFELEPITPLFQFLQPVLHDARLRGVTGSPFGLYDFTPGARAWRWAGAAEPH
ncbi:MAG TPA: ABC transporter substrate-binding protein [Candidatus Polarisedimenticolaceae bacterium]